MGFKSATVKTVFTFSYKVFDTSYTVGQDYNEVATEVITQLQDECSVKIFKYYLFCTLDESQYAEEDATATTTTS